MVTCKFCGKELQEVHEQFAGIDYLIGYEPCQCERSLELRAQKEAEAQEKETSRFTAKLLKAGIAERYHEHIPHDLQKLARYKNWRDGFYICGDVGTGKTTMASQFAARAIMEGVRGVRFVSSVNLLGELRDTFNGHGTEAEIINRYCKNAQLLVLDDLGKDIPTQWTVMVLYRIINDRYEHMLPTIITSQYTREQLSKRLSGGDQETAKAIISRLEQMGRTIALDGRDKRKA